VYEIILFVLFHSLGEWWCQNVALRGFELSRIGHEKNEAYDTLYWVDLGGVHLEGANLTGPY